MKKFADIYDDNGIRVELSGVVKDIKDTEYDCVVSTNMYVKIESKTEDTPTEVTIEFGVGKIIEIDGKNNDERLRKIIKINNESLEKNAIDIVIKHFKITDFEIIYIDEEVVHSV